MDVDVYVYVYIYIYVYPLLNQQKRAEIIRHYAIATELN